MARTRTELALPATALAAPVRAELARRRHTPPPDPVEVARRLAAVGAQGVGRDTPGYPRGLCDLDDPPDPLYVRGRLPSATAVAIVGARAASPYGLARAGALARDLAQLGCVIVSGLARGIDAAAHRGALEHGGASVAVLPGGIDTVVPPQHDRLAAALLERGALVSEWPCGGPFGPGAFVTRNRIVAALSQAVVVVEAAEHSGALTTAGYARRLRRPVLAVPGDVDRPTSRGAHALLRDGAAVCEHAGDVVAALERGAVPIATAAPAGAPPQPAAGVAPEQLRVLAALAAAPQTVDRLSEISGCEPGAVLAMLLRLQWNGLATAHPGQRWSRATRAR